VPVYVQAAVLVQVRTSQPAQRAQPVQPVQPAKPAKPAQPAQAKATVPTQAHKTLLAYAYAEPAEVKGAHVQTGSIAITSSTAR
jgi:hypothetical protein